MVKRLLLINGLAILCVVLFHATGWGFTAMFSWTHRYLPVASPNYDAAGTTPYYALRIIEQLVQFCIAAFLFVSGFFVAFSTGRSKPNIEWKVVGTRIKFLLIPYLLWTAILTGLLFLQGRTFSTGDILRIFLLGGANPAYYFVPLLIQLYLLSPILVPLAKKHWKILLVVTGLLQILMHLTQYPLLAGSTSETLLAVGKLFPRWIFYARVFWFSFGIIVGFHLQDLKEFIVRHRWVWLALAAVLFIIGIFEWEYLLKISGSPWNETRETLVDMFYAGSVILALLGFSDAKFPLEKWFDALGTKSFGIYISHSPVQEYFSRAVYHLAPSLLQSQLFLQPMLILLGVAIPLLAMSIMKRTPLRRFYSYVFG